MKLWKWIVGIDFSMTCPAVTVAKSESSFSIQNCQIRYLSEKIPKQDIANIVGTRLGDYTSNEQRFDMISDWVLSNVRQITQDAEPKTVGVFIEDYSFGSKGKTFHIAENTGLVKHKLWKLGHAITPIPPTVIKKFAFGKGNATKDQMYSAFVAETGVKLMPVFQPKANLVGSPTGDLVDSFYICKYGYVAHGLQV